MGSLATVFTQADGATLVARNSLAILMAMPLVGVLLSEVWPRFRSMPPAQAVVVFGVVGGASGVISQSIAGGMLESLGRSVNIIEMLPAVGASVLASAIVTWAFLPPNPNPATTFLRQTGRLPS